MAMRRQWEGKPALRVSIPAKWGYDSDLIIGEALLAAMDFIGDKKDAK